MARKVAEAEKDFRKEDEFLIGVETWNTRDREKSVGVNMSNQ